MSSAFMLDPYPASFLENAGVQVAWQVLFQDAGYLWLRQWTSNLLLSPQSLPPCSQDYKQNLLTLLLQGAQ